MPPPASRFRWLWLPFIFVLPPVLFIPAGRKVIELRTRHGAVFSPGAPVILPFRDLDPVLAPSGELGTLGLLFFEPILRLDASGRLTSDFIQLPLRAAYEARLRLDPSAVLPNGRPCTTEAFLPYLGKIAPSDRTRLLRGFTPDGTDAVRIASDVPLAALPPLLDELLGPGRARVEPESVRTILTLKLRSDLRWGDGPPIRAADLKAGLERARRIAPRRIASLLDVVESMETPDDATLVLRARGFTADPLAAACFLGPWPSHRGPADASAEGLALGDTANGPLKIAAGRIPKLRGNTAALRPAASAGIDWPVRPAGMPGSDAADLHEGKASALEGSAFGEPPRRESAGLSIVRLPAARGLVATFTGRSGPLGDPRTRQSMSGMLHEAALRRAGTPGVTGNAGEVASFGPLPGPPPVGPPPFDAVRIRGILAADPLRITAAPDDRAAAPAAEQLQDLLRRAGLPSTFDPSAAEPDLLLQSLPLGPGRFVHPILATRPGPDGKTAASGVTAWLLPEPEAAAALAAALTRIESDWPGTHIAVESRFLAGDGLRTEILGRLVEAWAAGR